MDWQGLKLPSAERRQRDSLKKNFEVWKDWIRLKKEFATLGEKLPPVELLPAKRKKQSPDPKNNPERGIEIVARQMHQKTVQHYWVNIVKQEITGGGGPTLRDTLIQPMEAALNQPTFLTQAH